MAQVETLAAVALLQDWCHRAVVLHPVLHPLLRPNAAAHQRHGKGHIMDHPLRPGQDLSIRRPDHPRRRRLQTPKNQTQTQKLTTSQHKQSGEVHFKTDTFRPKRRNIIEKLFHVYMP